MDETKKMLDKEIEEQFKELRTFDPGSKERIAMVEDLTKLCRLRIEERRAELEKEQLEDRTVTDWKQREEQLTEQAKDRWFKLGIAAAELVLPLAFYAFWMHKGFKFEETGAYTSTTFKGLFSRFRPTNK